MTNDDWRFEYSKSKARTNEPICIQGVARRGEESTRFSALHDESILLLLMVEPTRTGLGLVRSFEQAVGPSTLLYMFERGKVKGYLAEWHLHADNEALNQRIDDLKQGKISGDVPEGLVTFLHRNSNHVI